jgi:outer membrane immunogenic protein
MKKILLAGIAAAAFCGAPAIAADMPTPPPPGPVYKAPPPVFSWAGFYVGGNVGGVWSHDPGTTNWFSANSPANLTSLTLANTLNHSDVISGVHGGYNWQVNKWVFGFEGDFDWTRAGASFCRTTDGFGGAPPCSDTGRGFLTFSERTNWLATARGRIGWAWDQFMVYGTAGAAWGEVRESISASCLVAGCGFSNILLATTQPFTNTRSGWVAGVGGEYMITPNWIARLEYLHYDLGSLTNTLNLTGTVGPQSATWASSFRYDTVRAGISYKFGSW